MNRVFRALLAAFFVANAIAQSPPSPNSSTPSGVMLVDPATGSSYSPSGIVPVSTSVLPVPNITAPISVELIDPATGNPYKAPGVTLNGLSVLADIAPTFATSAAPTITYPGANMSGAVTYFAVSSSNVISNKFSFYGAGLAQKGPLTPQFNVLISAGAATNSLSSTEYLTSFYVQLANQMDIVRYGDGNSWKLWIDNTYVGEFDPPKNSGTAQAGTTSSITLAAGASSTTNNYVGYTVNFTGGTGSGELCTVSAYNGSTKVATCTATLGTAPDATTTYVVVDDQHGYQTGTADGLFHQTNINWGAPGIHKIDVMSNSFMSINIGPNDTVWPAPPVKAMREIVIGDSFIDGSGGPYQANPQMSDVYGRITGWQIWPDGEGSTGWASMYSSAGVQRLNFVDRCAPPAESWQFQTWGSTAGTYTLSVTYGGSTQTTGSIAFNATDTTVQTAVQALSNLPASSVTVAGNGAYGRGWMILLHSAPGATMSYTSSLTGGNPSLTQWSGVIAPRVPKDALGNALPFVIYIQGSENDNSVSSSTVQTNATTCAQAIVAKYPTAVAIFSGVVGVLTHGGSGVIDATDVALNTAIKTAAQSLPKINGNVPFIDTYSAGVGGNAWIFGAGNIGSPTANKNDILISLTTPSHPTGFGHSYLAYRVTQNKKALMGAQ